MKKLAVVVLALLSLPVLLGLAWAQGPLAGQTDQSDPKRAEIAQLLQIMNVEDLLQHMLNISTQQVAQGLARDRDKIGKNLSDSDLLALSDAMVKTNWAMVKGDFWAGMIAIYAKYFTHDEIKQLTAFYRTPLGKRVLEIMPVTTREGGEFGQYLFERFWREFSSNKEFRVSFLEKAFAGLPSSVRGKLNPFD